MSAGETEYKTLKEFWPYYLSEHLNPVNRGLHVVGSTLGLGWLGLAIATQNPWLVLAALVNGYAFAWIGHFVIEKNRPATFTYPFKSFVCDWIMLFYILTGRIGAELEQLRSPGEVMNQVPEQVAG